MKAIEYLTRLFRYDDWANREMLAAIEPHGTPRDQRVLAHVLAAEELWWRRLRSDRTAVVVWPDWSWEQCRGRLGELSGWWTEYLAKLDEAGLSRAIEYVNSKGEPWSSSVGDILFHVVMHSAYHRGQLAAGQRAAGQVPVVTDFIHCARQGLMD